MTGMHPEPIGDSRNGTDDRRPPDLGALRRSDELFDALSERRAVSSDDADDPAFALLQALVEDVDAGAPPLVRPAGAGRDRRTRRLPRTLVSLCVATTVLMTTGVAAAGGVLSPFSPAPGGSEPHVRSHPELPESRGVVTGVRGSPRAVAPPLKRRDVVFPRGGAAAVDDGRPQAPQPTRPPTTASPTPQATPYDLYVGPPDSPAPSASASPEPTADPSVSPLQGTSAGPGQQSPAPGRPAATP